MITFLHENIKDLVAFRLEDKVTAEDIDQVADALEEKFDSELSVNIYVELDESFEESLGGIFEQAKKGFTVILPNLGKIKKAALVTDKTWLKRISEFEDLFLTMEIKGFRSSENDLAFQWITS